jgi:hypothetical protein
MQPVTRVSPHSLPISSSTTSALVLAAWRVSFALAFAVAAFCAAAPTAFKALSILRIETQSDAMFSPTRTGSCHLPPLPGTRRRGPAAIKTSAFAAPDRSCQAPTATRGAEALPRDAPEASLRHIVKAIDAKCPLKAPAGRLVFGLLRRYCEELPFLPRGIYPHFPLNNP